MEASKRPTTNLEKIGIYGLIVSLLAALIIAALSVGGVVNMTTVKALLVIAGLIGAVGIVVAAIWHSQVREWIRSAAAVVVILSLGFGLWWLYSWVDKNGQRPAAVAFGPAQSRPVSPQVITKSPPMPVAAQPTERRTSPPARKAKHSPTSDQKSFGNQSPNTSINGPGQVMDNSPGGIQQLSTGPSSPNTVNIDTHVTPRMTGPDAEELSKLLTPFAGTEAVVFVKYRNDLMQVAYGLQFAMEHAGFTVSVIREGMRAPEPPPGLSFTTGEDTLPIAETIKKFLSMKNLTGNRDIKVTSGKGAPHLINVFVYPW